MKVILEFENIGDFFTQLPRFASLMNFSGQFANITQRPKAETEQVLGETELPAVDVAEGVTRVGGTKAETATEAGKKIEAAYDAAEAAEAAAPLPSEDPPEAPRKAAKPGKAGKPKKPAEAADGPTEAAPEAPEAPAARVTDADVRKALNALIKAGKRDDVKAILKGFGAGNFSQLDAGQYPEVLKKAEEALKNG